MHYHGEIWVPNKNGYRSQVDKALEGLTEENNGFYDWYVIGGRWSGEHTLWLLKNKFGSRKIDRIHDEFDKKHGWWTNSEKSKELRAKQYEEVFRNHISEEEYNGIMPAWRDNYKEDGYEDDILAVTDIPRKFFTCYTLVLSPRGEKWEEERKYYHSEIWNGSIHQDTEFNPKEILEQHNIYDGFLVTVDYHN